MRTHNLTKRQEDDLAYLKAKKASDAEISKTKQFGEEMRAGGRNVTAIGRIRRWTRIKAKAPFAAFANISTFTAIAIGNSISKNLQENLKSSLKKAGSFFAKRTAGVALTNEFTINTEYVRADALPLIEKNIEHHINAVEQIADGTFIGPYREEIGHLVSSFGNALLNREDFTRQALAVRGVIFSQEHDHYALSAKSIYAINATFNDTAPSHKLEPVLAFKRVVENIAKIKIPAAIPTPPTPAFMP